MSKTNYPQVTMKAQMAIAGYVVRRLTFGPRDLKGEAEELGALIEACIPHGSLRWAEVTHTASGALCVRVQIQGIKSDVERGEHEGIRTVDPETLVLMMALTIFKGHSRIKNVSDRRVELPPDAHPNHYVYVHQDGIGQTWQHVIAGAGPGEEVRLGSDHKVLCMEEMTVIPSGHRTKNSRNVAVYEAERLYQVAAGKAAEKGMTLAFTKASYKALIQACFKLLDETHGHKLRREGPQVQSTVVSRAAAE